MSHVQLDTLFCFVSHACYINIAVINYNIRLVGLKHDKICFAHSRPAYSSHVWLNLQTVGERFIFYYFFFTLHAKTNKRNKTKTFLYAAYLTFTIASSFTNRKVWCAYEMWNYCRFHSGGCGAEFFRKMGLISKGKKKIHVLLAETSLNV